jgi:hypothetical protein
MNPADEVLPPRWQTGLRWGAPALALLAAAWVVWNSFVNPGYLVLTPGPGK